MTGYLLRMFGISLGLTLAIELAVGRCFGLRGKRAAALVILVNVLTNPAAVLACWLGAPQLLVELLVVATEALVYRCFSEEVRHPVWLAVAANGISWILGLILGGIL